MTPKCNHQDGKKLHFPYTLKNVQCIAPYDFDLGDQCFAFFFLSNSTRKKETKMHYQTLC